jgi:hypothetical protein
MAAHMFFIHKKVIKNTWIFSSLLFTVVGLLTSILLNIYPDIPSGINCVKHCSFKLINSTLYFFNDSPNL